MVRIPAGWFLMGSNEGPEDERPQHRVEVAEFFIDRTKVTNSQFALFLNAIGAVGPLGEKYFDIDDNDARVHRRDGKWSADAGFENNPLVEASWYGAVAYCRWTGKRLPTEAEWEFAARGGLTGKIFPWGDELTHGSQWMGNTHQGHFPDRDTGADSFVGVGPVAQFPPNDYGLYDVGGNVWEWVSDWYRPDYYSELAAAGSAARNPQGPSSSHDPEEPGVPKRVHRGGSFLCTDQYCSRYMVGARGKGDVGTSTNHLGFRMVLQSRG